MYSDMYSMHSVQSYIYIKLAYSIEYCIQPLIRTRYCKVVITHMSSLPDVYISIVAIAIYHFTLHRLQPQIMLEHSFRRAKCWDARARAAAGSWSCIHARPVRLHMVSPTPAPFLACGTSEAFVILLSSVLSTHLLAFPAVFPTNSGGGGGGRPDPGA